MQYNDSSGGAPNPAKPTPLEFRCDVDRVIKKCLPGGAARTAFSMVYIMPRSDEQLDIEIAADRILGVRRHNLEEGMGAEFIRRKLYPTNRYFKSIRKPRNRKAV